MSGRRPLALAVLTVAAGGLLVLLASGRVWSRAVVREVASGGSTRLSVTGHTVAPSLPALGLALLALAAAVLAGRGPVRRVVGVVVVVIGAATTGVAVSARGDVGSALTGREVGAAGIPVHAGANAWWVVAAVGAVLATAAGATTVLRGRRWAALGAAYDAPTAPKVVTDVSVGTWDALDRGEDPTA